MPNDQTTREPCPTCGALPCDHVLNPADDPVRTLLAEGLDLCVRARKLDEGLLVKSMKDNFGYREPEGTRSLTPWLWTQEQYDRDLADWETRARKALS